MNDASILTVEDVTRTYTGRDRKPVQALAGVTLDLWSGRRIGIIGESGSGKSTLVRILLGLETPSTGTVNYDGIPVTRLRGEALAAYRRDVQLVAQDTSSSFDPLRTLRDAVRRPAMKLLGMSRAQADERVDEVLRSLTVDPALADRKPWQVSGGQRQRFAIARALIVGPRALICDESVSALDVSVQGAVLNEIKAYCERNHAALIFVSHGVPATAFVSDELMVMHRGVVVEHGTTDQVVTNPRDSYTAQLISAYRTLADDSEAAA